jgi:hypothetical protein
MVGIDPAMTLIYRQEYVKTLGIEQVPNVLMLQEWLATRINTLVPNPLKLTAPSFKLLSHCTEKTNAPGKRYSTKTLLHPLQALLAQRKRASHLPPNNMQ